MSHSVDDADIPRPAIGLSARRGISTRTFVYVATASLGLLWLVVTTGALVRLTASGLGCPHWPTCEANRLVPQDSGHALIEFSNRVISGIAMVATVIAAVMARRTRGLDRGVATAAALAAIGTIAQVPLGALTVALDLNPLLVMSHFLLAMAVVAVWTWVTVRAVRLDRGGPQLLGDRRMGILAWCTAATCLALVTTGAFVTASGPHPGSTSTPIERLWNFYRATWLHVRIATIFTVLFVVLAVWIWRRAARTVPAWLVAAAIALIGCQAIVGEVQYRNGLPWQLVAVHVALAATLLMLVVAAASFIWEPSSVERDQEVAALGDS
jgi:cytochrome c oxidase assembly protein subunit 15